MKNKLFIFSAILLVAVTTITIVSCKKDKTEERNPTTENVTKNIIPIENEYWRIQIRHGKLNCTDSEPIK